MSTRLICPQCGYHEIRELVLAWADPNAPTHEARQASLAGANPHLLENDALTITAPYWCPDCETRFDEPLTERQEELFS